MNYFYLNELERNLEIQAHSYLLQKDDALFESQTRTEFNQVCLVNRLKSHTRQFKKFFLTELILTAKIVEVFKEHILVEENEYKYLIKVNQILGVNNLKNSNSKLTRFEEKWNLKSSLRDLMLHKINVQIKLINQLCFSGTLNNFFNDHFDLVNNREKITLNTEAISWVKYKSELEVFSK